MKDPAFLFYPNDYIGGTLGMTFEQKGAYIELLMTQFNRGHMTSHMIGQVLGQNSSQLWEVIQSKFKVDDEGKYYNERLEVEQNKRKAFTDSRKNNISGSNQYSKKDKAKPKKRGHKNGHMTSHMENRNRNEIMNIVLKLKELFSEKYFNKNKWYDTIQILIDKHKYSEDQITKSVTWARQDNFWNTNFLSLQKLIQKDKNGIMYIDIFIEKSNKQQETGLNKRFDIFKQ